jgi:hypothetical protein
MENTILWLVALVLLTLPFLASLNRIQEQSQRSERSISKSDTDVAFKPAGYGDRGCVAYQPTTEIDMSMHNNGV